MACTCITWTTGITNPCTGKIGGIESVTVKRGNGDSAPVAFEVNPEGSSYNAVMTYDKAKNLKYWTTDVTLTVSYLNEEIIKFLDGYTTTASDPTTYEPAASACPITLVLTMYGGGTVTVSDAYITTSTFASGATKTDGQSGNVVFQAITANAPTLS